MRHDVEASVAIMKTNNIACRAKQNWGLVAYLPSGTETAIIGRQTTDMLHAARATAWQSHRGGGWSGPNDDG
jgi:hypothetical protein